MNQYDELQKLQALKESGALTEDEYQREKQRVLAMLPAPPADTRLTNPFGGSLDKPWGLDQNVYCTLMHLSQFAGYTVIPFLGLALPIVMWLMNKDRFPAIDAHGKNIANWMLSAFIYGLVFVALSFILIGIPMLWVLGICAIIFPIIAAIKANQGYVWRYPGAIPFFG